MDLLESGLRRLGLCDAAKLKNLRKYTAELELWNRRYNLVRAEGNRLIIRHILDSLAGVSVLRELADRFPARTVKAADIGSGAGLPGIPLAMWLRDTDFFLVEKSEKRCGFLRNVTALCGLQHCRVICAEAEQIPEKFHLCVFRALGDFLSSLRMLEGVTAPAGFAAAYKGRRETIEAELESLPPAWKLQEVRPLSVPFLEEERHIVILVRNN